MTRHVHVVVPAILLAACQPAGDSAPSGPATPTDDATPAAAPASLVGEYRVAGIDGAKVGGDIGIGLSITETAIFYQPRCAGFDWTYSYEAGALTTERPADTEVCAIGVHPEQQRLAEALDLVARVARTPSNGIELTGGGHSVTLFSQ
ncbi:hypothetical protein [Pelagerythrobacter marensis]|uniref:DUF306 domain-containing protein n=1 Tax=Pelagerythrobacter marensis TaxID=543877 RepID=A0A0G3X942_9SPHN|nr:hypothetical protein [Pelagerythrobacter marensis]AKM08040.1 hypothetical protein AM2010_1978 [Pelagerythrobacter marensis]